MWKEIVLSQNPVSSYYSGIEYRLRIRSDVYPSFVEYNGGLYVSDGKGAYTEMLVNFHSFSMAQVMLLEQNEEE